MPVSDEFADFVIDQLSAWAEVSARKMFGGAGLYCDGVMFGLIADDVTYLKVDDSNRDDFIKAGSSPFQPYPDKAATMSYYEIPADVLEDREELAFSTSANKDTIPPLDFVRHKEENLHRRIRLSASFGCNYNRKRP